MVFKVLKILAKIVVYFILSVVAYVLVALILSAIPVKAENAEKVHTEIFLISNGVHSDLVLPVKNDIKDWSTEIKFEHAGEAVFSFAYVGFGWGDKAFYLETPEWSDLKFTTAFNAVFGLGPSAIHATFFEQIPEGDRTVRLSLSADQYRRLVNFIESAFDRDSLGQTRNIPITSNYGPHDAFYEARGRYNLFITCNTWTNNGLKAAGQKACVWTPFDKTIFWHYR